MTEKLMTTIKLNKQELIYIAQSSKEDLQRLDGQFTFPKTTPTFNSLFTSIVC